MRSRIAVGHSGIDRANRNCFGGRVKSVNTYYYSFYLLVTSNVNPVNYGLFENVAVYRIDGTF